MSRARRARLASLALRALSARWTEPLEARAVALVDHDLRVHVDAADPAERARARRLGEAHRAEDDAGAPVWVPIDATTTRDGRPLRVPRRPPGRFRAPRDPSAKAPAPPRWDLGLRRDGRGAAGEGAKPKAKRKRLPPRVELTKVLHHLGLLAGRPLEPNERAEVERALTDPEAAAALLDRLRGRSED